MSGDWKVRIYGNFGVWAVLRGIGAYDLDSMDWHANLYWGWSVGKILN